MESFFGIDLTMFAKTIGLVGLFIVIFAESGLLIGFFLPGDSLLFAAGFLASQGTFNLWVLTIVCFIGAVLGDSAGYAFGRRVGRKIFIKDDSLFFHKDHVRRAEAFYERHGKKTVVLARFMPIVRTFAPILAGVGNMHYRTFLFYNIWGGALWTIGLVGLGYVLGSAVPHVDRYILPIIGLIVVASVTPPIIHLWREKRKKEVL